MYKENENLMIKGLLYTVFFVIAYRVPILWIPVLFWVLRSRWSEISEIVQRWFHTKPTWNVDIPFAPVNKQAVMCVLHHLALQGDAGTARAVCRKSWFEDFVIEKLWYQERAVHFSNQMTLNSVVSVVPSLLRSTWGQLSIDWLHFYEKDRSVRKVSRFYGKFNSLWKGEIYFWISFHSECIQRKVYVPKKFNLERDVLCVFLGSYKGREMYVQEVPRWNIAHYER